MGFLDELKKMTRPYDDDDEFFDDEDEAIPVAEAPAPERPAPARPARRTAPAAKQSSFIRDNPVSEPVREPERPAPGYTARSDSRVADKVVNLNSGGQLKVVLVAPKQFELAAEIADHLPEKRTARRKDSAVLPSGTFCSPEGARPRTTTANSSSISMPPSSMGKTAAH